MMTETAPKTQLTQTRCSRCIMDSSVPGIAFDDKGVCNFCKLHDKMERDYPIDESGKHILEKIVRKIKKRAAGKKFDCVLGISGGRDSTFTLYYIKKILGLNPLAVHFNDGFGNPVAGENMIRACEKLGVELRTITSDWRESKDLKIAFLKAGTPDLEEGTDLGIATSLFGVAAKEDIHYILIGQSFRTEGIAPLAWNYLDGKYLKSVHKKFGSNPLRKWKPEDPGFNLGIRELIYYSVFRGIRIIPILYYVNYVRKNVDELLEKELGWVNTGAHYFDDLYQSLMTNLYRTKFNIDRRLFNYSALVRSGQMSRDEALKRLTEIYVIEDPKVISLCIKRLGLTQEQYEEIVKSPPKTFQDYPNSYGMIKLLRPVIKLLSLLHFLPGSTYDKYFNCGKY
jgi:N-acetyl sugar amidotransferase